MSVVILCLCSCFTSQFQLLLLVQTLQLNFSIDFRLQMKMKLSELPQQTLFCTDISITVAHSTQNIICDQHSSALLLFPNLFTVIVFP